MTKSTSETAIAKDAPQMRVECLGITTGEWEGQPCYVLKPGKILEIRRPEKNGTATPAGQESRDAQAQPAILTPKQMDSLKTSIQRDGFCAPILVRPYKRGRYEIISGNHRFMAACELGMAEIPCVVSNMDEPPRSGWQSTSTPSTASQTRNCSRRFWRNSTSRHYWKSISKSR